MVCYLPVLETKPAGLTVVPYPPARFWAGINFNCFPECIHREIRRKNELSAVRRRFEDNNAPGFCPFACVLEKVTYKGAQAGPRPIAKFPEQGTKEGADRRIRQQNEHRF
jgi:hypothetical protein